MWCSYEVAVRERADSESKLESLRENVDECTSTRVDLECKLMTLRDELDFENLIHFEVRLFVNSRSLILFWKHSTTGGCVKSDVR